MKSLELSPDKMLPVADSAFVHTQCRAEQLFAASNNVITLARTAVMYTNAKNLAALEHAVSVFDRLNRGVGAGGSEV